MQPSSLPALQYCVYCIFIVDLISTWLRCLQFEDPDDVGLWSEESVYPGPCLN